MPGDSDDDVAGLQPRYCPLGCYALTMKLREDGRVVSVDGLMDELSDNNAERF